MNTKGNEQSWILISCLIVVLVGCDSAHRARARQPTKGSDASIIRGPLTYVALACLVYAYQLGSYPFSPQGSDEALRLAVRNAEPPGSDEFVDACLRFRSSVPGEVDFLYLNDPDAGRLPPDTIMVVEKYPLRRDGRLYVAILQLPSQLYGSCFLVDAHGLEPGQALGRALCEFPGYDPGGDIMESGAEALAVGRARYQGIDAGLYTYKIEASVDGWSVLFTRKALGSMRGSAGHFVVKVDRQDGRTTFLKGP